MRKSSGEAAAPESLARARLLPPARQRAWDRDLVRFHLDEINGCYDRLQRRNAPAIDEMRRAARARIDQLCVAASWSRDVFVRELRTAIAEGWALPEDSFAAAALVLGLGVHREPPFRDWLASLPADVHRSLTELGLPSRDQIE